MLLLMSVAGHAHAQRSTVSFDLGWRVHPAAQPKCAYPVVLPGYLQNSGTSPPLCGVVRVHQRTNME